MKIAKGMMLVTGMAAACCLSSCGKEETPADKISETTHVMEGEAAALKKEADAKATDIMNKAAEKKKEAESSQ